MAEAPGIQSHADVITVLGGSAELARALRARGVAIKYDSTVNGWKRRANIPSQYWPHIRDIANEKGIEFGGAPVTLEVLLQMSKQAEAA